MPYFAVRSCNDFPFFGETLKPFGEILIESRLHLRPAECGAGRLFHPLHNSLQPTLFVPEMNSKHWEETH